VNFLSGENKRDISALAYLTVSGFE
jgi:hypothetical protein